MFFGVPIAFDRGDMDTIVALLAMDVEYVPPSPLHDGPSMMGREAVREFWRKVADAISGESNHEPRHRGDCTLSIRADGRLHRGDQHQLHIQQSADSRFSKGLGDTSGQRVLRLMARLSAAITTQTRRHSGGQFVRATRRFRGTVEAHLAVPIGSNGRKISGTGRPMASGWWLWVPKMSSDLLARDDAYGDLLFPTAVRPLLIWYDQVGSSVCAPLDVPAARRQDEFDTLHPSIYSSCSRARIVVSGTTSASFSARNWSSSKGLPARQGMSSIEASYQSCMT